MAWPHTNDFHIFDTSRAQINSLDIQLNCKTIQLPILIPSQRLDLQIKYKAFKGKICISNYDKCTNAATSLRADDVDSLQCAYQQWRAGQGAF